MPIPVRECYSEFLPTSDYLPPAAAMHFRFTARDRNMAGGGNNSADTTLTLAANTGPFLVTAPNTAVTYPRGSTQTITWDKANTDIPPINTANVKISLSTDGGLTYPTVLAASTANDGAEAVMIPNSATTDGPREDRGGRQRLLRRLERELHDRRAATTTASAATAASAASATTASATSTASSPTTTTPPPPAPPPARCRVPNVIGLRLQTARSRIRARRCRVGTIRRVRSRRVGRVLGQSPRGGAVRRVNFRVNLRVGRR